MEGDAGEDDDMVIVRLDIAGLLFRPGESGGGDRAAA